MDCYFRQDGADFAVGNGLIERAFRYGDGQLSTVSITDRRSGGVWPQGRGERPETYYEGLTGALRRGAPGEPPIPLELVDASAREVEESMYSAPHLDAVFTLVNTRHKLTLQRHFLVYEGAAAVRSFLEVVSGCLPAGDFFRPMLRRSVLDAFSIPASEGTLSAWEFFTRSDRTNTFVEEHAAPRGFEKGNLLLFRGAQGRGLFVLKESPCFSDQRPEVEGNFHVGETRTEVLGWGFRPEEIPYHESRRTYGSVVGVFQGGQDEGILELKRFQNARATVDPGRDDMVMANPWGEGNLYELQGEKFVLEELSAAADLGATHYQLDDGWESGNLVDIAGNAFTDKTFWTINPGLFPRGFGPAAAEARKLGVEFTLWFCPSSARLYRDHAEQAEVLLGLWKRHGIRRFKIDGMNLRTKECEDNLEALLRGVREASRGAVAFNLDTTADPRPGYFMFQEYGNIFLENRYSLKHAPNYYPWLTLKNLWDLSPFVPSRRLQIEFLNIDKGGEFYDGKDELAPRNYSHEYVAAVTLCANPLAWFAPSRAAKKTLARFRTVIDLHKAHRNGIFSGHVFPVGQRPSGRSWTGFQSHDPESGNGYLAVYREYHPEESFAFNLKFVEGRRVRLTSLSDRSPVVDAEAGGGRGIAVNLPAVNSWRLYKYATS